MPSSQILNSYNEVYHAAVSSDTLPQVVDTTGTSDLDQTEESYRSGYYSATTKPYNVNDNVSKVKRELKPDFPSVDNAIATDSERRGSSSKNSKASSNLNSCSNLVTNLQLTALHFASPMESEDFPGHILPAFHSTHDHDSSSNSAESQSDNVDVNSKSLK